MLLLLQQNEIALTDFAGGGVCLEVDLYQIERRTGDQADGPLRVIAGDQWERLYSRCLNRTAEIEAQ